MDYRVLIVNDGIAARLAVAHEISRLCPNWQLFEAQDAEAAMSVILDDRIDIAVIDHNMPRRDGLSLAANLRALRPTMPMALISEYLQAKVVDGAKSLVMA